MAEYNPFDVTRPRRSLVNPVGMADPNQTGIPDYGAHTINSGTETGIPPSAPTGGVNPGGMYSGTQPQAPAATSYAQQAPSGWNQGKWADQSHTTPKYVVGRILSQFPDTPEGLQAAMPQIQQAFPGATMAGRDSINIPGIGIVDVGVGFAGGGGQGWAWQPDSDMAGGAGGAAGAGAVGAGGGGAFGDSIRARIQQLMSPSDPMGSPVYQGAMRAYDQSQQRGTDRTRNAIAERMAASGQANSGAMDSQIGAAEQASGEASANFAGNLGIRALEGQRDEIMQALQLGAGLMTDEQRLALTEKLGLINANLQQQGITNQNNQFTSNMGWEQAQYSDLMNRIPWQTIFGAQ
jgi:hypothetical protein